MTALRTIVLLAAMALATPLAAAAQGTHATMGASVEQFQAAARLAPATAPAASDAALAPMLAAERASRRDGITLMIVGVAGMVTGLLIDESAVTILSAGIAGLGLYFYVR